MLSLLEMSVTGGILAAVAVIIRAVAVNRLPKKVFLAFWAAVLCCLFFPFRIPSPVSVYAAVPSDAIRRPGVLLGNAAAAPAQDARQLPIALLVWAFTTDPADAPPLPLVVFFVAIPAVVIVGVLIALLQRFKQIKGGEEDAASQY